MITQYDESGSIPADVQNIVANSVSLGDYYILMRTGENRYSALIQNMITKSVEQLDFTRPTYNGMYEVTRSESTFDYSFDNEYYIYSNIGFGKSLDLPIYDAVTAYSVGGLVCFLVLFILLKEVLFRPWLSSKRR